MFLAAHLHCVTPVTSRNNTSLSKQQLQHHNCLVSQTLDQHNQLVGIQQEKLLRWCEKLVDVPQLWSVQVHLITASPPLIVHCLMLNYRCVTLSLTSVFPSFVSGLTCGLPSSGAVLSCISANVSYLAFQPHP